MDREVTRNRIVHEEVIGSIGSLEFIDFKANLKIEMKTKAYSYEKLNDEKKALHTTSVRPTRKKNECDRSAIP
jgi:hypothetical protein